MVRAATRVLGLLAAGLVAAAGVWAPTEARVITGAEILRRDGFQDLPRDTGILTNPTAMFAEDYEHLVDAIHESPARSRLIAVFGPEHGFRGDKQAGEGSDRSVDPRTGLIVYDTYGKRGARLDEIIRASRVRHMVFDIQDVGTRFYTYIWSLWDLMESCARLGLPLTVLDRPNPIGGHDVSGPVLRRGFTSGVGRLPIALRHGMTVGELALYFNEHWIGSPGRMREFGLEPHTAKVGLRVIPMQGWTRKQLWPETGLPWVGPSPNIPGFEAALVYPGFGLLEGINCSEGRGTTRPFEIAGAPYLNDAAEPLATVMNGLNLSGVQFREIFFTPTFNEFKGRLLRGTQAYITDMQQFDPIDTAINWLLQVKRLSRGQFGFDTAQWFDLLSGNSLMREGIDAGRSSAEIATSWKAELEAFKQDRARYLLY